jgi:hypothetical protein
MNIFDRIKKIEKQALQLKSDADAIPVLFIKPFSGSKNLYTIWGENYIFTERELKKYEKKHSVTTTIVLNIPRRNEKEIQDA